MSADLSLSAEEIELVKKKRVEKELIARKERFYNAVVYVSHEFLEWKKVEGFSLTFSTFLNDFGCMQYVPDEFGSNLKYFYDAVKSTLDSAASYANNLKLVAEE